MITAANFLLNYLANSLWQLPLFVAIAYALERLIRRAGPLVRHRLWVSTLLLAVTMPAIGAATKLMSITYPTAGTITYVLKMDDTPGSPLHRTSLQLSPVVFNFVVIAYLAITLAASLRLLNSVRRARRLIRDGKPVSLDTDQTIWRTLSGKQVELLSSDSIATPVTIGWRNPILLVPVGFEKWQPEDATATLAHECAHIDRHDFFWNLLYEVLAVFVFYHPVVRILKSRIAATRETVCDAVAAGRVATPVSYARSLLRIATEISVRPAPYSAIGMFDGNVLEKRIMELTERKQLLNRGLRIVMRITAVVVFTAACFAANAFSINVEQKTDTKADAKTESVDRQVYKVEGDVTEPELIKSVNPAYPPKAKEEKRTGVCTLEMVIDEKGIPQDIKVIQSLAPDFDENAVNAVKQWRFSPATLKGKPVAVRVKTEVNFQLY